MKIQDVNINKIMGSMTGQDGDPRVFHNEAQFQFELAWTLKKEYEDKIRIFFEYATLSADKNDSAKYSKKRTDLIVADKDGNYIAIELKYKTLPAVYDGFKLGNHQARDLGRYDFLYDVVRLQNLGKTNRHFLNEEHNLLNYEKGYAILLTNDAHYWKKSKAMAQTCSYANFCISKSDVFEINNKLSWKATNNGNLPKLGASYKNILEIDKRYELKDHWIDYRKDEGVKNGEFKYLILPVDPKK